MNSKFIYIFSLLLAVFNCNREDNAENIEPINTDVDINNDGKLNILLLGTSSSIDENTATFSCHQIVTELNEIIEQDPTFNLETNIEFQNIYKSKEVAFGLGQAGNIINTNHFSHSLMQFYYWPENQIERWSNLKGEGNKKWDYIIITADTHIIENLPGYYALGVNKLSGKNIRGRC